MKDTGFSDWRVRVTMDTDKIKDIGKKTSERVKDAGKDLEKAGKDAKASVDKACLLYTSPSPRD